jgi:hypothetical protein
LFDFYPSHVLCFVWFISFVLYVLFFVDDESDDEREDDSNHDQLSLDVKNLNLKDGVSTDGNGAKKFTFDELAVATGNFRADCFVREVGFGKVYEGYIEKINQVRYKLIP